MLQFVGADELAEAGWLELLNIHAQPPGFNVLLKFTDLFGASSQTVLLGVFIAASFLGVWMTADITYRLTSSIPWGIFAGIVAGVIPGSTYYSLWVFYTIPTAFLLTTTVWGFVRSSRTGSIGPITLSVAALVAAALMRSSIVWVLVLAWIAVVLPNYRRIFATSTNPARALSMGVVVFSLAGLGAVQVNAFQSFGTVSLSSWGFENTSKALQTTLSDEETNAIVQDDACLEAVVETGVFRPIDEYPECARLSDRNMDQLSPLLTEYYWTNGGANMNNVERLALSRQWLEFTSRVLTDDPTRVLRIPFPSLENQERGTIVRFLWPSSWYWIIERNVSQGGLLSTLWIVSFAWVPATMLLLILLGLFRVKRLWSSDADGVHLFRVAAYATLTLTVLYLFLETGENERFRVEIDWLLIALGVSVLGRWWTMRKARKSERALAVETRQTP